MTNAALTVQTNGQQITRQALAVYARRDDVIAAVCADKSDGTRVKYGQRLEHFTGWLGRWDGGTDGRVMMGAYRRQLALDGKAPSTINGHLVSARAFVSEAAALGLWDERDAVRAASVDSVKQLGVRIGNWLSVDAAQQLLDAPDGQTLRGLRDRAILAVAVVCGLRRSEIAALTIGHLQTRDGHHIIADLLGKHGRVRTVVLPVPVWRAVDAWLSASGRTRTDAAAVFVPMLKGGALAERPMTAQAVYDIIRAYGAQIGHPELAAHDTRRTSAQLARRAGASLEAISQQLGHARLDTTQRYLGGGLDLDHAAADAAVSLLHLR